MVRNDDWFLQNLLNNLMLMKCFSVVLWICLFHCLPFQTGTRVGRRGGTSCERKPAVATAGKEDALFLPSIPCSWLMLAAFLPFSLPARCKAQLCHWELHQSPVCCWALRAAQLRLVTFTCLLHLLQKEKKKHCTKQEGGFLARDAEEGRRLAFCPSM